MHNIAISEDLRLRLAQSMAIVERRRAAIVTRITQQMAAQAQPEDSIDADVAARILFDLLIDGASDLAAFAGLRNLSRARRDHQHAGIAGRQYSRFGLALESGIHAVVGIAMPAQTLSAWCDAFWIVIREIASEDEQQRENGVPIQSGLGFASS